MHAADIHQSRIRIQTLSICADYIT